VNLACALSQLDRRVLIVDMDPQGNASSGLGIRRHECQERNIYPVLIGETKLSEVILPTAYSNLFLAAATPDLVGAEIELVDFENREFQLKAAIQEVADQFDYVLI